jgi:hypothetical protein
MAAEALKRLQEGENIASPAIRCDVFHHDSGQAYPPRLPLFFGLTLRHKPSPVPTPPYKLLTHGLFGAYGWSYPIDL